MRAKRWVLFIALNVVVSVLTTLAVLASRGELQRVVVVTVTPAATAVAVAPAMTPTSPGMGPAASATSSVSLYEIQPGDTLGGVALAHGISLEDLLVANDLEETDIIRPGEMLAIPLGEALTPTPITPSPVPATPTSATPSPFPTETPTPPGPVQVRIQELLSPGNLAREGVVIVNRGRTVNLLGWTLGPAGADDVYTFPRITLAQGVQITLYTTSGADSPQALHWGQEAAMWDTSDTPVELRDAGGDLIATYTVP